MLKFFVPGTEKLNSVVVELSISQYHGGLNLPTLYMNNIPVLHIEPSGMIQFNQFNERSNSILKELDIPTETVGQGWYQLIRKIPLEALPQLSKEQEDTLRASLNRKP